MEARRRDVRELAVVLMQVLLGTRRGAPAPDRPLLPAPFDDIVRNGMNGSWGLAEIAAALGQGDEPEHAAQAATPPQEPVSFKAATAAQPAAREKASASGRIRSGEEFLPGLFSFEQAAEPDLERKPPAPKAATYAGLHRRKPSPMEVPVVFGISEQEFRRWTVAGVVLLGVILLGSILLHREFVHHAAAAQPVSSAPTPSGSPSASATRVPQAASPSRVQWRVVAFTYSRQDQAQKKVSSLAHRHPNLSFAVFSPNGRAPWLVTVGGALDRDAAYALARKARSLGLPRDTYAQNYTAR